MTRSSIIGSIALFTALSGSALADDLTPPPWRFTPGSTVQHWDFSAGAAGGAGGAPDAGPFNNIYGIPTLTASTGTGWSANVSGRNDVWGLFGGSLNFDVPNTGVTTHQKNLWLQVTFLPNAAIPFPTYAVASTAGPFTQVGAAINTLLPGGWVHQLTVWNIQPCPLSERVAITSGIPGATFFIDQVVIDTQCIPVPSAGSTSLLACAGLIALRRRRR